MYRIVGSDGAEHGPVSAQQASDWIAEGRLNRASRVQVEGGAQWQSLGELAEFAAALAAAKPPTAPSTPAAPAVPAATGATPAPTSGLAIASLVLGILGLITCGITALAGLVLGIVGLTKISRSQGRLSGSGLAIAGICVSGVFLLWGVPAVSVGMLLPALAGAKGRAQEVLCMSSLKQLNLGLLMYAGDNNDVFPPADRWCDAIKMYVASEKPFQCPAQPEQRSSFALNAKVAGKKTTSIKEPGRTVLAFGCAGGWNRTGGQELASSHKHVRRVVPVGFADGHVELVPPDRLASLRWEP